MSQGYWQIHGPSEGQSFLRKPRNISDDGAEAVEWAGGVLEKGAGGAYSDKMKRKLPTSSDMEQGDQSHQEN
jgi:hypothetical protein